MSRATIVARDGTRIAGSHYCAHQRGDVNVIMVAGQRARGATLYLEGLAGEPCWDCILAAGIDGLVTGPVPECEYLADEDPLA